MKPTAIRIIVKLPPSPPVRGRGLKPTMHNCCQPPIIVAPRAGAWIETLSRYKHLYSARRRPPCGGVD